MKQLTMEALQKRPISIMRDLIPLYEIYIEEIIPTLSAEEYGLEVSLASFETSFVVINKQKTLFLNNFILFHRISKIHNNKDFEYKVINIVELNESGFVCDVFLETIRIVSKYNKKLNLYKIHNKLKYIIPDYIFEITVGSKTLSQNKFCKLLGVSDRTFYNNLKRCGK